VLVLSENRTLPDLRFLHSGSSANPNMERMDIAAVLVVSADDRLRLLLLLLFMVKGVDMLDMMDMLDMVSDETKMSRTQK